MSFNLAICPTGWTELVSARGKVIVGLDPADASFNAQGETGGEKTHTLTVAEMPSHTHTHKTGSSGGWGSPVDVNRNTLLSDGMIGYTGGNQPHNNLQPYIALVYCEKD